VSSIDLREMMCSIVEVRWLLAARMLFEVRPNKLAIYKTQNSQALVMLCYLQRVIAM
jgi:hypothetical protein